MAQRLPIPGKDNNKWGDILNGFLAVEHNPDGTLIKAGDIAIAKAQAATAVQTINGKSATNGALTLAASDVGAISQATADSRYISGVKQSTAPANPATNDLWYDSANDQWKRWNGSAWVVSVGAVQSVDGQTGAVNLANSYVPASMSRPSLHRWSVALGNRSTEPADILFIGDSLPSGQASSTWARTYPTVCLGSLRNQFPVRGITGGIGFIGCDPAVYTSSLAPSGFPDIAVSVSGVTSPYLIGQAGNGLDASTAILTKAGDSITWTFTGDGFDMLTSVINAAGSASLTVDGTPYEWTGASPLPNLMQGSIPLVNYAGNAANAWYGLRGLAVGTHTVTLTWASGSYTACGLFAYNGDANAGIRLVRACISGQGTSTFYGGYASHWLSLNIGITYFPDLIVIDLGNDDHTGTTASHSNVATYTSNLKGIISTIKAGIAARTDGGEVYVPSFLLTPMHGPDPAVGSVVGGVTITERWSAYQDAMYQIAATDPDGAVAVLDLGRRLTADGVVPYPFTNDYQGLLSPADKVHYSDAGSDWAGNTIAHFLAPQ